MASQYHAWTCELSIRLRRNALDLSVIARCTGGDGLGAVHPARPVIMDHVDRRHASSSWPRTSNQVASGVSWPNKSRARFRKPGLEHLEPLRVT